MTASFHAGETAVQARVGVREQIEAAGSRMIRNVMPAQHREFFAQLPTLLVGSLDAQARPWASMLAGAPGFIQTPDERLLRVAAWPQAGDPLAGQLAVGAPLGLLGIQPHTRRRNRMNGSVVDVTGAGFGVAVEQSFGNCPKYIQAREPQWRHDADAPTAVPSAQALGPRLSDAARALVSRADTLFIASASARSGSGAAAEGVDVSHRGGKPGFVQLALDAAGRHVLTLPDFRGNFLFNTLGNIAAHPFAGLLFVDYQGGALLQLTGRAEIVWDGPALRSFAGAQRLLQVTVEHAVWRPDALPLRWSDAELAPQLIDTGSWQDNEPRA